MTPVDVRVVGLGKRYRLGVMRSRYRTLRDVLSGAATRHAERRSARQTGADTIWALRDVSFELARGTVLGVIGPNGAGKSTLLKILSRITVPTEGYAEIHGRVGSLLEVGTGFHPELTGRENIYLNAAILGMRRPEIQRKFDEIVEFSGVTKFIDTPIKHYSSGMYVRLAFAVAASLEPEILLVDEVLAVGDAAFQQKCLGKMREIGKSGRTVLFVSHNMAAIRKLCSRALLIEGGRVAVDAAPEEVIRTYLKGATGSEPEGLGHRIAHRPNRSGHGGIRVVGIHTEAEGQTDRVFRTSVNARFIIEYAVQNTSDLIPWLHVGLIVVSPHGSNLFCCSSDSSSFRHLTPRGKLVCTIKSLPLIPGDYFVTVMLKDNHGIADWVPDAARFQVIDDGSCRIPYARSSEWGSLVVDYEWVEDRLPVAASTLGDGV